MCLHVCALSTYQHEFGLVMSQHASIKGCGCILRFTNHERTAQTYSFLIKSLHGSSHKKICHARGQTVQYNSVPLFLLPRQIVFFFTYYHIQGLVNQMLVSIQGRFVRIDSIHPYIQVSAEHRHMLIHSLRKWKNLDETAECGCKDPAPSQGPLK